MSIVKPGEEVSIVKPALEAAREAFREAFQAFQQRIDMEVRKAEILDRVLERLARIEQTLRKAEILDRVLERLERLERIEQTLDETALFVEKFATPRVVFTRPSLCMNPTPSECKRSATLMGRTYCDQADDSSDYCCHLAPLSPR